MSTGSRLTLEVDGRMATLSLTRPDRGNSIDLEFGEEFLASALEVASHPVRVLVIRSSGPHFCFGGDLKEMSEAHGALRRGHLLKLTSYLHTAVSYLANAPYVIITATTGACAGAGFGLVLASDIVIGGRSATYTPAFSAVGLTPDTGVSFFLPQVVGRRRASELLLTNRTLNAEEAWAWGILNQVVEDEEVTARATALAQRLTQGPPQALSTTKRLLASSLTSLESHLARESFAIAEQGVSAEAEEGIRAFLDKRKAKFMHAE